VLHALYLVLPAPMVALRMEAEVAHGAAGEVPGLQNLGCSFLSLDTDGRVVRLDSVAKVRPGPHQQPLVGES
jgi:hypothetical protein